MKTYINLQDLLVRLDAEIDYDKLKGDFTSVSTLERVKEIVGKCASISMQENDGQPSEDIVTYIHTDERVE